MEKTREKEVINIAKPEIGSLAHALLSYILTQAIMFYLISNEFDIKVSIAMASICLFTVMAVIVNFIFSAFSFLFSYRYMKIEDGKVSLIGRFSYTRVTLGSISILKQEPEFKLFDFLVYEGSKLIKIEYNNFGICRDFYVYIDDNLALEKISKFGFGYAKEDETNYIT